MSTDVPRTDRREDGPLLRGHGTFIDGLRLPELDGALHAVFVRSIEPHGRLVSVETSEAVAMPGVVAVLTGDDLTDVWVLPPRLPMMNQKMVRPMMAQGVVRFVGEPVAVVLAESRAEAADAAEYVMVDTERLEPVIDLDDALLGDVLVHESAGTNVSWEWATPPFETDPFAECEIVEEFSMRHPRLHAGAIEPRAGAAVWTPDGRCTAWVCSQRPAGAKYVIECALGLESGTVRVVTPDVGGGFGSKGGYGCQPEDVVIAWAARRLGRAVRWVETRTESMLSMGHGRASTHQVRIGGTRAGDVLAYEVAAVQDSGAYPAMGTFITTNLRNSGTGVYKIPSGPRQRPLGRDQYVVHHGAARRWSSGGRRRHRASDGSIRAAHRAGSGRGAPPQPRTGRRVPVQDRGRFDVRQRPVRRGARTLHRSSGLRRADVPSRPRCEGEVVPFASASASAARSRAPAEGRGSTRR